MNRNAKLGYVIVGAVVLTTLLSILVWADSTYPFGLRDVTQISSTRSNLSAYPPDSITAEAGNVTELSLNAISVTKAWQGYFGNITGTITLEDINGNVFYNWTAVEPKGEIFASTNDSITWTSIVCFNWSGQSIDLDTEEARYGITDDSPDGINETYASTGLDTNFFVGTRNITSESTTLGFDCHTTNTYQNGAPVNDNFENVLLTDQVGALVFTTIIENNELNNATDIQGFDAVEHDFQLLVAENGFDGFEDTLTTYYFWAEIQ